MPPLSLYYCLFAPHVYGVVLRAHSVRGKPRIQRNASGVVATTSPHILHELHRSHVLFVTSAPGTTFTSWSQHDFVAIGKSFAQSFALWQQATIEIMRHDHSIIACSRHKHILLFFAHIPFVVNHTFNATPAESLQQYLFMISRLRSLNNVDSFTFHELHSYVYYHRLQHLPQLVSDFFIDFSHPKSVAKIGHNLASTWPQSIVAFEVWTASKTMTQKEKSCIQSKVAN